MGNIRRKRKTYRLPLAAGAEVRDLAPGWRFTLTLNDGRRRTYDFARFRDHGRGALAAEFRDAIWQLRHTLSGETLYSLYGDGITRFWAFLGDRLAAVRPITELPQIDRCLLDIYLTWLQQHPAGWSICTQRHAYQYLKTLLVNRAFLVPQRVHADIRNQRFPRNPFPHAKGQHTLREPYSEAEQARILQAAGQDIEQMRAGAWTGTSSDVLSVFLLLIALRTGRNPTPLVELRRDALRPHPLDPCRDLLVTYKRRGYSTHVQSFQQQVPVEITSQLTVPQSVGELTRWLLSYTEPLLADARPEDRDFLLLYRTSVNSGGRVVRLDTRNLHRRHGVFVKRHNLRTDQGQPLRLNMARLRTTFAEQARRRSGGDLGLMSRLLGHCHPNITSRHYVAVTPEMERRFKFLGEALEDWATSEEEAQAIDLTGKLGLTPEAACQLLAGGWNTTVARCRDPFHGRYAPKDGEGVCEKFLHCFKCPSMVVFEDDLYRLFSFYFALLSERGRIGAYGWAKTYGWVIQVIDDEIVPRFPLEVVEVARQRARENSHPVWRHTGTLVDEVRNDDR